MKKLIHILLFLLIFVKANAQLTVNTGVNATALVNTLLGSGVTATNVSFQGVMGTGAKYQAGLFTASGAVATNLGITSGIVLSSGHVGDIPLNMSTFPGATSYTSSGLTSTCSNGEIRQGGTCPVYINDVDILAGNKNYYNAAILEFDFVPQNSTVSFSYVFGSEEYDQNDGSGFPVNYNCSSYNDKFGFIISGPGISGGQGYTNNGKNIARLGNGAEVSINSVNDGIVGASGGSPSASVCTAANPAWTNGSPTSEFLGPIYGIQFNGNTKKLSAYISGLTAGSTYHIKLIVTDVNDGAYDSGVFLQAASFTSPVILPVDLVSFSAACKETYTEISWSTATEKNNDYFILQKAASDFIFKDIATINGKGTTAYEQIYTYKDYDKSANSYYQLVQVDADGTKNNSKIIYNKQECGTESNLSEITWHSATNSIHLQLQSNQNNNAELIVTDLSGKLIFKQSFAYTAGLNELDFNLKDINDGMYICTIADKQIMKSKKILINTK